MKTFTPQEIEEFVRMAQTYKYMSAPSVVRVLDIITYLQQREKTLREALGRLSSSNCFTTPMVIGESPLADEFRARLDYARAVLRGYN